jgi:hypothetical protein
LVVAFIVTVQLAALVQPAPDQPVNDEPPAADAVSVTAVPALNVAVQVEPQLMPAGLEVTVPVPEPLRVTFIA